MAFISLTEAQIAVSQPTAKDIFRKTKDNQDDHETRITGLEASGSTILPIEFEVRGQASIGDEQDIFIFPFDATILAARIFLIDSGSSGTLTVDIEKSTNGGGAWSSIFSTLPSVDQTDGDYFRSINQVFLSTPSEADTGDFIRLNIDSVITGSLFFKVRVQIEVRT